MSFISPSVHPATQLFAITPNDSVDIESTRGLYVGVSGDVAVVPFGGTVAVTLVGLAAGVIHPVRAKRVLATGTTATDILGVL